MGGETWPIEISLTDRESMRFRLLIGRTAMHERRSYPTRPTCCNIANARRAPLTLATGARAVGACVLFGEFDHHTGNVLLVTCLIPPARR